MIPLERHIRLLDFGCGDGLFLNILNRTNTSRGRTLTGYDPYMEPMPNNSIGIVRDWKEVEQNAPYDYVTCFEVLEHFSPINQKNALMQMSSVLTDNGLLIISVPIEKGIPSVVKNILRKSMRHNETFLYKDIYSINNILRSFRSKPFLAFRNRDGFLPHLGFYYTDLEAIFSQTFDIVEKSFSPFPFLGYSFNSQVFYKLKKKPL
jgi:SAM-dependent methyltransferase